MTCFQKLWTTFPSPLFLWFSWKDLIRKAEWVTEDALSSFTPQLSPAQVSEDESREERLPWRNPMTNSKALHRWQKCARSTGESGSHNFNIQKG